MKKIIFISCLITALSCSKIKDVLPSKNKTIFNLDGKSVSNPVLSLSDYATKPCTAAFIVTFGAFDIEGVDDQGRKVKLIIFGLASKEGKSTTSKYNSSVCQTHGFLAVYNSATNIDYYDIPGGIPIQVSASKNTINIGKIKCTSPFGKGNIEVEVSGIFETSSIPKTDFANVSARKDNFEKTLNLN